MWQPINETEPAGTDVSFDPDYEQLESEIRKTESLAGEVTDWSEVVRLSTALLREKSKDFRVASYLVAGLFHVKNYPGLAEGLTAYQELAGRYWDNGYPPAKRVRARLNAWSWLSEQLEPAIAARQPSDAAALTACVRALDLLNNELRERLGGKAPDLSGLMAALETWAGDVPAPAVEEAPAPESVPPPPAPKEQTPPEPIPEPVAAAAPPRPDPPAAPTLPAVEEIQGDPTSVREAEKELEKLRSSLRSLSVFLRENDPRDPAAIASCARPCG